MKNLHSFPDLLRLPVAVKRRTAKIDLIAPGAIGYYILLLYVPASLPSKFFYCTSTRISHSIIKPKSIAKLDQHWPECNKTKLLLFDEIVAFAF